MAVEIRTSRRWETLFLMKSERERAGGEIPRKVWRFAPPKSASTSMTRRPSLERLTPMLAAIKLFPLPPFPPPMVQIIFRLVGWGSSIFKNRDSYPLEDYFQTPSIFVKQ